MLFNAFCTDTRTSCFTGRTRKEEQEKERERASEFGL
jgi:hypothetical protein